MTPPIFRGTHAALAMAARAGVTCRRAQRARISGCSADEFMRWQEQGCVGEEEGSRLHSSSSSPGAGNTQQAAAAAAAAARASPIADEAPVNCSAPPVVQMRTPKAGKVSEIKMPESLRKHMDRASARWRARKAAEGSRFTSCAGTDACRV